MRYSTLILEPYSKSLITEKRIMEQKHINNAMKERIENIQKAATKDNKLTSTIEQDEIPDYSSIKTVKAGNLISSLTSMPDTNKAALIIKSKESEILLDLTGGGRIAGWKQKNHELVESEDGLGLFVDGFWYPSKSAVLLRKPMKVIIHEATDEGIKIVLQRKLTKEAKLLSGLTIKKTFTFSDGPTSIKAKTKIINTSGIDKEFSHRFHNMIKLLGLQKGKESWADLKVKGKNFRFKRIFIKQLFRFSSLPKDKHLFAAFSMDKIKDIDEPNIGLGCDWIPLKLKAGFDPKELSAVVFWDSGLQKTATLEPIHHLIRLKPEEKWQVEQSFTLQK
jgi:hypothetical protein